MKALQILKLNEPIATFKQTFTAQQRWKKHLGIIKGSNQHVSIVVEKLKNSKIKAKKPYILIGLKRDCTVYQLHNNIRRIFDISVQDSLVLFCNNFIPNLSQTIQSLEQYCESDGFIYFYVGKEEPFG